MAKKSSEKFFVLWRMQDEGPNWFEAMAFDTVAEARAQAENYLIENNEGDGEYYIAKATEKLYYKKEIEKL